MAEVAHTGDLSVHQYVHPPIIYLSEFTFFHSKRGRVSQRSTSQAHPMLTVMRHCKCGPRSLSPGHRKQDTCGSDPSQLTLKICDIWEWQNTGTSCARPCLNGIRQVSEPRGPQASGTLGWLCKNRHL